MSHYTAIRHYMAAAMARITEYAERPVIRVPATPLRSEYSYRHNPFMPVMTLGTELPLYRGLFTIRPSGREFVILDNTHAQVLCDWNGNTRQPTIAAAMNVMREYVAQFNWDDTE